jgi:magnesium transporter
MEVLTAVDPGRIADLRARGEFFWLDLEAPGAADVEALGEVLGLHRLALQDTTNFGQEPKLDDYEGQLLVVFYSVREADEDPERRFRPLEVHVYVSGDFAVTVHRHAAPALAALQEPLTHHDHRSESTVVYKLLRALCDAYIAPLRDIAARVDRHEEQVFTKPTDERLVSLYHLKQEIHELLRRAAAQREQFKAVEQALERLPGLVRDPTAEMRDIRDQLREVTGELTRHHEDATTLVHLYFASNQDRLTRLATRLTVLATFFLAWTLVTGFFGQNFKWLTDGVASRTDFFVFGLGGLLAATGGAAVAVRMERRRDR